MDKVYLVMVLPKDEDIEFVMAEPEIYKDYGDAFDAFNEMLSAEISQVFTCPKREIPLRAVLKNDVVELWIAHRTDELIKK